MRLMIPGWLLVPFPSIHPSIALPTIRSQPTKLLTAPYITCSRNHSHLPSHSMLSPTSPNEVPKKTNFFGRLALFSKTKLSNGSSSSKTKNTCPPPPPSDADFLRRKQEALQQYVLVSAKDQARNMGGAPQGGPGPSAADAVRIDWARRQSAPAPAPNAGLCDSERRWEDHHRAQPEPPRRPFSAAAPPPCDDLATLRDAPTSSNRRSAASSKPCPSLSRSSYAASETSTVSGMPVTPPYNKTFDIHRRTAADPSMYSNSRMMDEMDRVKRENRGDEETQRLTEMAFFS